ncbi:unnamed protein product, partial [marine sediment metagenome]
RDTTVSRGAKESMALSNLYSKITLHIQELDRNEQQEATANIIATEREKKNRQRRDKRKAGEDPT